MTALLVAEAVHPDGYIACREGCLHCHVDGLDDACCGIELAHLVLVGLAEVGLYEFFFHE